MERFSYKGGCGVHEHTHIETFIRRAEVSVLQGVLIIWVNLYAKASFDAITKCADYAGTLIFSA